MFKKALKRLKDEKQEKFSKKKTLESGSSVTNEQKTFLDRKMEERDDVKWVIFI